MERDLSRIAKHFRISGGLMEVEPLATGHINDTYVLTSTNAGRVARYVLQRINHVVFKEPPCMMDNIIRVIRIRENSCAPVKIG